MNAHKFAADKGSKTCNVCGKTRNAKAHKDAVALDAQVDAATEVNMAAEAQAKADALELEDPAPAETYGVAEAQAAIAAKEAAKAEPWGIPPVPDFVPSTEDEADAQVAEDQIAEEEAAEQEATPSQTAEIAANKAAARAKLTANQQAGKARRAAAAKKAEAPTIRIWVGWRISNAAVLEKTTVAAKLREAKPNSELDRFVRLTVEELRTLDAVAVKFEAQGNTGPAVYSARTLRRRIAEAIAKLEADTKENDK